MEDAPPGEELTSLKHHHFGRISSQKNLEVVNQGCTDKRSPPNIIWWAFHFLRSYLQSDARVSASFLFGGAEAGMNSHPTAVLKDVFCALPIISQLLPVVA
jgi:hypothetical protein